MIYTTEFEVDIEIESSLEDDNVPENTLRISIPKDIESGLILNAQDAIIFAKTIELQATRLLFEGLRTDFALIGKIPR